MVTKEQAVAELQRRQAVAELQRRQSLSGGIVSESYEPEPEREVSPEAEWYREQLRLGNIQPVKSFTGELIANWPQLAGETVGTLAGAKAGAVLGAKIPADHPYLKAGATLGGAVIGAGVGAMGGKGWEQYYRMKTGGRPKPLKDLYVEQLWAGLEGSLSELAGAGVMAGGSRLLKPITKRIPLRLPGVKKALVPGAEEAQEFLGRYGTHLTYGQALQSRVADLSEEVAQGSWFGGGGLYKLKEVVQPKAIRKAFDDQIDNFAKAIGRKLTPDEVGKVLADTIAGENRTFRAATRSFYRHVDNLIRKQGGNADIIDLRPLKKWANKQLASRAHVATSETGETVLKNLAKHPDYVNFHLGDSVRSQLLMLERNLAKTPLATKDVAKGTVNTAFRIVDKQMMQAGSKLKGNALEVLLQARKFHKAGKQKFGKKVIQQLQRTLKESPEKYSNIVFRPDGYDTIKNVKNTVTPETWDALRYGYVSNTIKRSEDLSGNIIVGVDKLTGKNINPISGRNFINNFDKLGEKSLRELFSSSELKALRTLGRAAELTQGTAMFGKQGRMLVTLTQAGIVVSLATFGDMPRGAGVIIIGPYAAAKMATSPTTSKLLSTGLKTLPTAPNAAGLAARIIREHAKYKKKQYPEENIRYGTRL
jgi:hypothetical protein